MSTEGANWHWRDSMRPARFFMFDARAAMLVLMMLIHPRMYTLAIFCIALVIFYLLERFGLTFEASLRKARASLCGADRPALIWTNRRRIIDLGSG